MSQGTIVKIFKDKGYGFIRAEGMSQDLFFHRSSTAEKAFDTFEINDPVEFEVGESAKGPRAENVAASSGTSA